MQTVEAMPLTDTPVFRFAPSPNGRLHLGHAYSALLNADLARAGSGRLLVRIEDIDPARCRPEFEAAIYDDLGWLGLAWETPVRRQSEHLPAHTAALAGLRERGLVYPAFLSRAEIAAAVAAAEAGGRIWPRDPDGAPLYPGAERGMSGAEAERCIASGAPFAWRLDTRKAMAAVGGDLSWCEADPDLAGGWTDVAADPAAWGDVILARRETPTSYHLSVVLDDAAQGITDVVRGRDLYAATSVHRLLQELLGLPTPRYRHHRLILDADGKKLSKSTGSTGLAELRAAGVTPDEVRRLVGL